MLIVRLESYNREARKDAQRWHNFVRNNHSLFHLGLSIYAYTALGFHWRINISNTHHDNQGNWGSSEKEISTVSLRAGLYHVQCTSWPTGIPSPMCHAFPLAPVLGEKLIYANSMQLVTGGRGTTQWPVPLKVKIS